nr:MAG TPA: hypothetical protein [Crassvirales sp.]
MLTLIEVSLSYVLVCWAFTICLELLSETAFSCYTKRLIILSV